MKDCLIPARIASSALTLVIVLVIAPRASHAITFNLIAESGTPQFAVAGFNAAASLWSAILGDNATINIQIGYASLGASVIGETSSAFMEASYTETRDALAARRTSPDDYSAYASLPSGSSYSRLINLTSDNPNGPGSAVPYMDTMNRVGLTTANAKVLGLLPQNNSLDAIIRFSSDFSFDFDPGNGVDFDKMDFIGVAAHEIGHALGFVSGVDDIDYFSGTYPGSDFSSNLLDLFRYSQLSLSTGPGVTDYTADHRDKFFSVDGGATELALFSNGTFHGDGNQASHWRDNENWGLLDPTAGYGELLSISESDRRMFDALGYTIIPEPGTGAFVALAISFWLFQSRRR